VRLGQATDGFESWHKSMVSYTSVPLE
jgi:hypothetical protein